MYWLLAACLSGISVLHSPVASPHLLLQAFYTDFLHVADDESRHFGWCRQHLQQLGYDYGCMPAHNLLWEGAQLSAGALHNTQNS